MSTLHKDTGIELESVLECRVALHHVDAGHSQYDVRDASYCDRTFTIMTFGTLHNATLDKRRIVNRP